MSGFLQGGASSRGSISIRAVLLFFIALSLMVWVFRDCLIYLFDDVSTNEAYNHALMLPLIVLFFVWQKMPETSDIDVTYPNSGLLVVLVGLALFMVGELSTLYVIQQYAFLVVLAGFIVLYGGWKLFRLLLGPFFLLVFMIPLPDFLHIQLSNRLQLISSQLGVEIIRFFGITVYLEGNVIDLGEYKLQVVDACSGLRYLFPLAALGYIAAYIFKGAMWKKVILFFSTIPITILMNSFRIGIIGMLVEYGGQEMAEGFLHDFEGWVVFMACAGILVVEMAILARVGSDRLPLSEAFSIEFPKASSVAETSGQRPVPIVFLVGLILLIVVGVTSYVLPQREEIFPDREVFALFPMNIAGWHGSPQRMDQIYIDTLKFEDYILADYSATGMDTVNLYVAYYASQRKGASAHSPRTCIPGGGWEITQLSTHEVNGVSVNGQPLRVNRAMIQMGDTRELVYYWFQQRGRVITSEYLVKLYLLWDALTKNRTDGALVRLTTSVPPEMDAAEADAVLTGFAQAIVGELDRFVPN